MARVAGDLDHRVETEGRAIQVDPYLRSGRSAEGVGIDVTCSADESAHLETESQRVIAAGQTLGQVILTQMAEGGADIDISGLEFDFVRSIRVWDVRYYSHSERGRDDDCSESYNIRLGTYGTQGEFGWQRTTPAAAPQWVLPSRRCSSSNWRRGVGVEWEDHEGNHGYEWVAY